MLARRIKLAEKERNAHRGISVFKYIYEFAAEQVKT